MRQDGPRVGRLCLDAGTREALGQRASVWRDLPIPLSLSLSLSVSLSLSLIVFPLSRCCLPFRPSLFLSLCVHMRVCLYLCICISICPLSVSQHVRVSLPSLCVSVCPSLPPSLPFSRFSLPPAIAMAAVEVRPWGVTPAASPRQIRSCNSRRIARCYTSLAVSSVCCKVAMVVIGWC